MDVDDPRTIGARLRRIRRARGKSLRMVAGLAGISKSHLDRIERGETALGGWCFSCGGDPVERTALE